MEEKLLRFVRGFCVVLTVVISLFTLSHSASTAGTAEGVDWLNTQVQPDGSFAQTDDLSTAYQSTAEVLRANDALGITGPGDAGARQFLSNETFQNTEYLARRLIAESDAGNSVALLLNDLLSRQNVNGGWGDFNGYDSTVLDTAFALEGLGHSGFLGTEVGNALFYLSSKQNADGGWSHGTNESSVYTTAQVLAAMANYQGFYALDAEITAAQNYVLSQQIAGNLWDETFQSALALIGLISTTDDLTGLASHLSALRAVQLTDGSWDGQVYATALALRALKLSEASPEIPGLASIAGTLIDGQTGLPLTGVTVDLSGLSSQQATTGTEGTFIVNDLVAGSYSLVFSLPNYNTITATTTVGAQQNVDFGTIQMLQGANATTGTIRGTVTDSSIGLGLADVTITASTVATPVQTDANGNFQISNVPIGLLDIQADKSGYSSAVGSADMTAGGLLVFSPALTPVVTPTTAVQGLVTDGNTGQPLAGVTINITGATTATATTDSAGSYRIENLNPGTMTVEAVLAGYDSAIAITTIAENTLVNFSPALYPDNTTPPGSNTAGVRGVVLDSTTNLPLAGVSVVATFGAVTQSFTTGVDGAFELNGFTEMAGAAQFSLTDYTGVTISLNLTPLEVLDIGQVRLRPDGIAQLLPDLQIASIDMLAAVTDPATLFLSGTASIEVINIGTASAGSGAAVLAFYDNDNNERYDANVDTLLGNGSLSSSLAVDGTELVPVNVNGQLPFRDAPIHAWVDSLEGVAESHENNNITGSSSVCTLEPPPAGQLDLALKWQWSGTSALPNIDSVHGPVGVAQLSDDNGDGVIDIQDIPDLVFTAGGSSTNSATTLLVALSGDDGHELWSVNNTSSSHRSSVALGDIDGDGIVEIIIPGKTRGNLRAFEHDGTIKWDVLTGPSYTGSWVADGVSIADIDHDGSPEILHNRHVFNADGSLRWEGTGDYGGYGNQRHWGHISIAADVDNDGPMEVIAGRTLYDVNGNIIWHRSDISRDGWNAIGNFDADDFAEIVLVSNSQIYLLEHTGDTIWGPVAIPGGGHGGAPTVADFDGDGEPEIGVAGANNYVVFETDGSIKWTSPTFDSSSAATGSSVFDFEGDGKAEVLYADERNFYIYDGETGAVLTSIHNTSVTTIESPSIADVDNDGQAEIIVGSTNYGSNPTPGIRVFESQSGAWAPTRSIWNQHSYHINNINDDGTIPVVEQSSWLSHNTYRLNTFAEGDALGLFDVTAGNLRLIGNGSGQLPALAVRIGNAGAATTPTGGIVSFYEGAPTGGGTLLGAITLPPFGPGDHQDIILSDVTLAGGQEIYAVVDPDDQLAECDESNNTAQMPAPDLKPDLVVSSIDTTAVSTNLQTLQVTGSADVTVANIGAAALQTATRVTLFVDDNGNGLFDAGIDNELGSQTMPSGLASGDQLTLALAINGSVAFRDSHIHAMVDSDLLVEEVREDNNVDSTASECRIDPPPSGNLSLVEKWHWRGATAEPGAINVYGPPSVAQLTDDNGDGLINQEDNPDLVFTSFTTFSSGILNVINGDDGTEIFSLNGTGAAAFSSPALGDIDNDGIVEIVISNGLRTRLLAFEHDGTLKWSVPTGPRHRDTPRDAVAIVDLDHDGSPEVIQGRRVHNADGTLRWEGSKDYGGEIIYGFVSIAADVDLQGAMEVVAGRTLYDVDGNVIWHRSDIGSDGFNAVGNFDDDEFAEIVLVSNGRVYLLEHTGETIWGPVSLPGGGRGGPPTVGDFDADGKPEIGVAGAKNYVVFETNGTIKWTSSTQDFSSNRTGSSLFDFEGDGRAEVLYADEVSFFIYDGETGDTLVSIPNGSGTTLEYPIVVDLDKDGEAEIIVPSGERGVRGVRAFESASSHWAPTRAIWNQHSYHISNVNEDGTIPQFEEPSWLSHNTYRLNTFSDRDVLSVADLTASVLHVIDNGSAQPFSLSVRVGNAGLTSSPADVTVAFYAGDPSAGGVLLASTTIDTIAPNGYQDIRIDGVSGITGTADIFAVVDAGDAVLECNESNNVVSAPVLASTLGQISVSTDQPVYAPSMDVLLQANVANTGALSGAFSATLQVEDAAGVVVVSFASHDLGALAGGASTAFTDSWNTGSYFAGPYLLRGILRGADGAIQSEAVTYFSIEHPDASGEAVSLRTTTDKPVYHTAATVQIQDVVQNLTVSTLVDDAMLRLTVMDPGGQTIHTEDISLGQLLPNTVRDLTGPLVLQNAPLGNYMIMGAVIDNLTGNLLATDMALFAVQPDLGLVISGTVSATYPTVEGGEPQTCTDTVTNNGVVALNDLPVRQVFARVDEAVEVGTAESTLTLAAGETSMLERTLDTTGLDAGDYACILQASLDGVWTTLDTAIFTVTVPPINIEATLATGDRGRVLVLVDSATNGGGAEDCAGIANMGLGLSFNPALASDATATIELFNESGALIDSEAIDLTTMNGAVNVNAGTGGVDLNISAFTASSALLSIDGSTTDTGLLGAGYQVITTITEGATVLALDSTIIPTSCTEPVFISDVYGGYQIRGLSLDSAGNDPHGNADIPAPWYQQTFLEALLDAAGWTYTIVTNGDDFATELRSGGYITYLLLSEQEQLAVQVEKELREAVFRGEGLVVAGGHDVRNGKLEAALGVKVIGKHSNTTGVNLAASALHAGFNSDFIFGEHPLRLELEGATALGPFNFEANSTVPAETTAVAIYDYGAGKSVVAGFDLLAEATGLGSDSEFAALLLNALAYVHPDNLVPFPGSVLPLELTLTNLGIATPGEVILTLPASMIVVDAGEATVEPDATLNWVFSLTETEVRTLTVWVRLPGVASTLTFTADVLTGIAPDLMTHTTATFEVVMQPGATLMAALDQLTPIAADSSRDNGYRQAETSLERVQTALDNSDYANALKELLKAADDLLGINEAEAAAIRLQVDQVIRDVEQQL